MRLSDDEMRSFHVALDDTGSYRKTAEIRVAVMEAGASWMYRDRPTFDPHTLD